MQLILRKRKCELVTLFFGLHYVSMSLWNLDEYDKAYNGELPIYILKYFNIK